MSNSPSRRFAYPVLAKFAGEVLNAAGMPSGMAAVVADGLIHAHAIGRPTHGLALLPRYAREVSAGVMKASGEYSILSDTGSCVTWDGQQLPGIWLTHQAVTLGMERARLYGVATIVVRNGHHIGCLATYLRRPAAAGLMTIIATSDPSKACVAPYGGTRALFTTNPIAVGIPTSGDPVMIDTSSSVTTNNHARTLAGNGHKYASEWLLDARGKPTNDPAVMAAGGTILPVGGIDHGHKGYSWAILVEALTQGLTGFGRSDAPPDGAASVFIQILDPAAFGGLEAYKRQTSWLADACQSNPPREGVERVRVPGQAGTEKWKSAVEEGVPVELELVAILETLASRFGAKMPGALS